MTPDIVTKALTDFSEFLIKYLAALAAVGALTMALIETCKKLFDLKTIFQFSFVKDFIDKDAEAIQTCNDLNKLTNINCVYTDTFSELIHLVSGIELDKARSMSKYKKDNLLAIFSLETASMMGKIQDAVDTAIEKPNLYRHLFIFATCGSDTKDAAEWMKLAITPPEPADSPKNIQTRSDLYVRLNKLSKRKLDRLQLLLSNRWANMNQLAANILGGIILFITLLWINHINGTVPMTFYDYIKLFFASIVGGILAPIAKDMISWLQKVKSDGKV